MLFDPVALGRPDAPDHPAVRCWPSDRPGMEAETDEDGDPIKRPKSSDGR